MKKTLPILSLVLLLAGCNLSPFHDNFSKEDGKEALAKAKFKVAPIDSTAQVEVFASMHVTQRLKNNEALLKYADPFKELYLMVFRQSRAGVDSFVAGEKDLLTRYLRDSSSLTAIYGDYVSANDARNLDGGHYNFLHKKNLHGMEFRAYVISGQYKKIPLVYLKGVYKSDHYFYQVIVWTLASRRDLYEGIMAKMIESLQENAAVTL